MPKSYFNENRFYAVQQVAEIIGVHRNTVYKWVQDIDDPLPSHRFDKSKGRLKIHGSDLNEWLANKKVDPLNE